MDVKGSAAPPGLEIQGFVGPTAHAMGYCLSALRAFGQRNIEKLRVHRVMIWIDWMRRLWQASR
jgi:hypothetical protein